MGLLKHYIHILSASTLNTILNIFCPTTRDCFTLVLFLADPLPQTAGCKQEYWHRSLAGKSTWRSLHQLAEPWKRQERPQTEHVDHPNLEQYLLIIVTRTSSDASEITVFPSASVSGIFPAVFTFILVFLNWAYCQVGSSHQGNVYNCIWSLRKELVLHYYREMESIAVLMTSLHFCKLTYTKSTLT